MINRLIADFFNKHPSLYPVLRVMKILSVAARTMKDYQLIFLDFPARSTPRYGYGKPPHPILYEMMDRHRAAYRETLESFLGFTESFLQIPVILGVSQGPCWVNLHLPGLDAVSLYSLLCLKKPKRYLEIGSGHSTKFVRRAIRDHDLPTRITSIDPNPRGEIDSICDTFIRQRVEDLDLRFFEDLEAGDFLFVDGTHRSCMNSDVTVVFLDILPRLRSGVIVEFHDILLPYDYPPGWERRYYSEQYLLGAYLLAKGEGVNILLPNAFISNDPELGHVLDPLWDDPRMKGVNRCGSSFWIEID